MNLELVQPELLLLIFLLVLLWILRPLWRPGSMPAKTVSSTLLWHRAIPQPRGKRSILPLLLTIALIVVAAGPRLILDQESPVVIQRAIDGTLIIDIEGPEDAKVEIRCAQQAPRSYFLSSAGEAVIEEQDLAPGTPIEVSVASSKFILTAPPQLKKPVILDRSELTEVSAALQALVKANRIQLSDSQPDVIIAREMVNESSVPTILFPVEEGNKFLPRAIINGTPPELLDGLHPRYWTVLRAKEISGDPILIDQEGHALLARTSEGFRWGFLPGSGDLARRSDWPVLLGRLIEELAAPELTAFDLTSSTGSVSFLENLAGAGVHLALILALLLVIVTPVVLG
ncbi:MAG: hypothetical protein AAEJ04_05865, partial [Planctomycetota bacterium]